MISYQWVDIETGDSRAANTGNRSAPPNNSQLGRRNIFQLATERHDLKVKTPHTRFNTTTPSFSLARYPRRVLLLKSDPASVLQIASLGIYARGEEQEPISEYRSDSVSGFCQNSPASI